MLDEALRLVTAAVCNAPVRPESSETTARLPHLNRSLPIFGRPAVRVGLQHYDLVRYLRVAIEAEGIAKGGPVGRPVSPNALPITVSLVWRKDNTLPLQARFVADVRQLAER
jgi:hypothetical protein